MPPSTFSAAHSTFRKFATHTPVPTSTSGPRHAISAVDTRCLDAMVKISGDHLRPLFYLLPVGITLLVLGSRRKARYQSIATYISNMQAWNMQQTLRRVLATLVKPNLLSPCSPCSPRWLLSPQSLIPSMQGNESTVSGGYVREW